MTRSAAAQLELAGILAPPAAPASGTRTKPATFRFMSRGPGEPTIFCVPRRYEDQGEWPNGIPDMVPPDPSGVERVMRKRAERVAAEMRGDKRKRATADASAIRALLLDRGALDHHEIAAALGSTPVAAAAVLTHLRNSGHVHRADTRKRPRTKVGDVRGPHTMGVWELTAQGRAATKREQRTGKKLTTYNDSGFRSSGAI